MSSMVVGSVWYARATFGSRWIKLAKINTRKKGPAMQVPLITTAVVSLVTAYVLANVTFLSHRFFGNSYLQDAVVTAFWLWLGFTAARFITHDAFEGRPWQLTLLNCAHELVTLLVMGLVIGSIGV